MKKLLGTIILLSILATSPFMTINAQIIKKDSASRLTDSIRNLPPLEVLSVRAAENSPFAKSTINKAAIASIKQWARSTLFNGEYAFCNC